LVRENATRSLRGEAGCRRFDVLGAGSDEDVDIALYEIYDDEAAFDAHLGTAHYLEFDAATAGMILRKSVRRFSLD